MAPLATPLRPRRRALRLVAAALLTLAGPLGLLAGGCTCSKTDEGPAPGASPPVEVPAAAKPVEAPPVYPLDAGPPDPLAARFCEAVQALPGKRKAECCAGSRVGADPVEACVRTLSYALAQGAVTLAAAEVDKCAEAMKKATDGCDWVTPFAAAIPPGCKGIVQGKLAEKAPCRSSLECAGGLRCQGLTATELGACAPPRGVSLSCGGRADTLAASTRQDSVDRDHPECEGRCARGKCEAAIAVGLACKGDAQCGKSRCVAGKCAEGPLPALGAACPAGACAPGVGCVSGVCVAPKAEGAACGSSAECRGECVTEDGGAAGTCAKRCPSSSLPSRMPQHRGRPAPRLQRKTE